MAKRESHAKTLPLAAITCSILALTCVPAEAQMANTTRPVDSPAVKALLQGRFHWVASQPLIAPATRPADPCHAIKDPSVVHYGGRWHVFCTIRSQKRTHQIEYLSFTNWKEADKAKRFILDVGVNYFCAPQVFYFAPQKKWYMIYQAADDSWQPKYQPAFSTTDDIADPISWSNAQPFGAHKGDAKAWLDFWIICDLNSAYLFFTSLDGHMWRATTSLADFPHGWSEPRIALTGDVFEASHTYCLQGLGKYLTLIEAENRADHNRRYYKAYLADRLDGPWKPLAATKEKPFASPVNVKDSGRHWTDSFSHGELLRSGYDQNLEVDPHHLRFLFQGVTDNQRVGRKYGQIPWRLGLLELSN